MSDNKDVYNDEDTVDDFLKDFGFSEGVDKALSPEEIFISEISQGEYNKIHNMRYHLIHEMSRYYFLVDKNITPMRMVANSKGVLYTKVEPKEYLRACLEYYLQMAHLPRFMEGIRGQKACNMQKVLDLLCDNALILDALERK